MIKLSIIFTLKLILISHMQALMYEGSHPYTWEINFDGELFGTNNCQAALIGPETLIAEAECIQSGLNISDAHIIVNYRHVKGVFIEVATVNKTHISFADSIVNILNIVTSKIVLLVTDKPVVSSDPSKLSTAASVLLFDDPCWYKEENLVTEIALSDDGIINFSRCFVPVFNKTDIDVSPCEVSDEKIFCSYNPKMSDKKFRLKNFVYCEKKHRGEKKYLIGMLMEKTIRGLKEPSSLETQTFPVESFIESGPIYF